MLGERVTWTVASGQGGWEGEGGPALISSGGEEDKHLDRFPQIGAPLPNVPATNARARKDGLCARK